MQNQPNIQAIKLGQHTEHLSILSNEDTSSDNSLTVSLELCICRWTCLMS